MKLKSWLATCFVATAVIVATIWFNKKSEELEKSRKVASAVHAIDEGLYEEAYSILKPLAESGDPGAQIWLASFYIHGRVIERNDAEAMRLFKLANIISEGCRELREPSAGWVYSVGRDFEKAGRHEDARRWYKYAEEMGYDPKVCPVAK